jgi:hypothetical protein
MKSHPDARCRKRIEDLRIPAVKGLPECDPIRRPVAMQSRPMWSRRGRAGQISALEAKGAARTAIALAAFVLGITATVTTRVAIRDPVDDCRTIKDGHDCNATPGCDWPEIYWRGPPGREYCRNTPGKTRRPKSAGRQ